MANAQIAARQLALEEKSAINLRSIFTRKCALASWTRARDHVLPTLILDSFLMLLGGGGGGGCLLRSRCLPVLSTLWYEISLHLSVLSVCSTWLKDTATTNLHESDTPTRDWNKRARQGAQQRRENILIEKNNIKSRENG